YWTIDYKTIKRKYGSPNHITANITHLEKYFQQNYFDVIIMNGVIGYGLNHSIDIEAAIDACFRTLDRGGIFVLGWNDHKRRKPVEI
ncbi:MAG: methyltransferase domain-containing protein, partial [Nitrospinae bacterium]|nr:methyltransferase domain-containing protein [Nitrospinota bacterium]